jgi:hypothetical protein
MLFTDEAPPQSPAREGRKPVTLPARTGVAWPARGEVRPAPALAEELDGLDRMRAAGDADGVRWCLVALLYWLDGEPLHQVGDLIESLLRPAGRRAA